ncbi:MAG: dihydroorotase family protein [Methanomicrobia archaeon]|nr:dihydroorotase family protein [Methanomicrobia archaeon]
MLFKNLNVVTSQGIKKCDILVENGKIKDIGSFSAKGIDFNGSMTIPSVIDMHVHCRDFNQSYKETVETATMAAISKGVTGIVEMPNTSPPVNNEDIFEERRALFKEKAYCDYGINFSVTDDLDFFNGYKFIKIFLTETTGKLLFKGDLDKLFSYKKPIAVHSDINGIKECVKLSIKYGTKLHVCHVSTKEEIEFLKRYKNENITVEVTPHHLLLPKNSENVKPDLGEKKDREALWKELGKTIDVIASDHAPHTKEEKKKGAYGIPGIETILPLTLDFAFRKKISFETLASLISENPAKIVSNKKGFGIGKDADFTVIEEKEWIVDSKKFYSKSKFSPFDGMKLKGTIKTVILRGEIVYDGETIKKISCKEM